MAKSDNVTTQGEIWWHKRIYGKTCCRNVMM